MKFLDAVTKILNNIYNRNNNQKDNFTNTNTIINQLDKIIKQQKIRSRTPSLQSSPYEVYNYRKFPTEVNYIYRLAEQSDTLTAMHRALRTEIFRQGIEVTKAEETDENVTDEDKESPLQDKPDNFNIDNDNNSSNGNDGASDDTDDDNGGGDADEEDKYNFKKIYKKIKDYQNNNNSLSYEDIALKLKKVNQQNESMIDLLKQLEDDINIVDHIYCHFQFEYFRDDNNNKEIKSKRLVNMLRLYPGTMFAVTNKLGEYGKDDDGKIIRCSPSRRDKVYYDEEHCPETGEKLYPVWFVQKDVAGDYYFFEWEILHLNYFRPRGYSPIKTAYHKIKTLEYQDMYMLELYEGKRPPKGLLAFSVSNPEVMAEAWEEMVNRAQDNPHLPAVIGIPPAVTGQGSGKAVEWIDFMRGLTELEFSQQREDFRRQIGLIYGLSPLLTNDVSSGGGLNNEGLQYTITNRAVESKQEMYNRILEKYRDYIGADGWIIQLRPSEEQDEMAKLIRQKESLNNGKLALELGLKAVYNDKIGEVVIEKGELKKQETDRFGGGFGGGMNNKFGEEKVEDTDAVNEVAQGGEKVDIKPANEIEETPDTPNEDEDKKPADKPIKPNKSKTSKKKLKKKKTHFINKFSFNRNKYSNELVLKSKLSDLRDNLEEIITEFTRGMKIEDIADIDKLANKLARNMHKKLTRSVKNFISDFYKYNVKGMEREIGEGIEFGQVDREAIETLQNDNAVANAIKDLEEEAVEKIKELFKEAYGNPGLSPVQLENGINEIIDDTEWRIETITRTEMGKVSAAARFNQYQKVDPEGEDLYVWVGPDDHRTTTTCSRIAERTKNGVHMDELMKIIREESAKDFPDFVVEDGVPHAHYNCRHTFARLV